MPSDLDADRAGVVVTFSPEDTVAAANSKDFVFIKPGLSPSAEEIISVFENNDDELLVISATYHLIVSPGDALNNFNDEDTDPFTTDDVFSAVALTPTLDLPEGSAVVTRITNVSNQVLAIIVDEDPDSTIFPSSGSIRLQVGRTMEVESSRLNDSQLAGLIKNRDITTIEFTTQPSS
jgi:hypothetical protein